MPLHELVAGTRPDGRDSPKVDIVAVHGLNPSNSKTHAFDSWTKESRDGSPRLWLRDDLPLVAPSAKILLYKYESFPALTQSKTRFVYEADALLAALDAERDEVNYLPKVGPGIYLLMPSKDPYRPLIFLAHSLGGVLVKQAMVNAFNNPDYNNIKSATCGLAFFATPHAGGKDSLVTMGRIAAGIVNHLSFSPPNDIMEAVKKGSLYADTLQESWRHQLKDYRIISFHEGKGNIVSRASASFGISGDVESIVRLDTDHRNMCRFDTTDEDDNANYKLVRAGMKRLYTRAVQRETLILPNAPQNGPGVSCGIQSSDLPSDHTFSRRELKGKKVIRRPVDSTIESSNDEDDNFEPPIGSPRSDFRSVHGQYQDISRKMYGQLFDNLEPVISQFVKSFSHYGYTEHFDRIKQQRYPATCDWLVEHDDIKWWSARPNSALLWISGPPGIGKSTLLTHLVDILRNPRGLLELGQSRAVVYSFCSRDRNSTASEVLSVAIHQMLLQFPDLQKTAFTYDKQTFSETQFFCIKKGKYRSAPILWNLFCKICQESKIEKVFLVIDALDQCNEKSQEDLIGLFHSAVPGPPCLKMLFSSRPEMGLRKNFSFWSARAPADFRQLMTEYQEDFIRKDIDHYIRGEVKRIGDIKDLSDEEKLLIIAKLSKDQSGIFLPVVLLFKEIEDEEERSVAQILEEMPNELQALFSKSLSQAIESTHSQHLAAILKYVTYWFSPLTVQELAYACSDGDNSYLDRTSKCPQLSQFKRYLRLLGALLKVREDNDIVTFTHVSAKEFLISSSQVESNHNFLFTPRQAHRDIAIQCLKLIISNSNLSFPTPYDGGDKLRRKLREVAKHNILLQYAMRHWHQHLRSAIDGLQLQEATDPELMGLMKTLIGSWRISSSEFRWALLSHTELEGLGGNMNSKYNMSSKDNSKDTSAMELLSALGLTVFLKKLLLANFDQQAYRFTAAIQSALVLAVQGGHESTVDLLIDHFNITSLDDDAYKDLIKNSAWMRRPSLLQKIMKLRKPRLNELVDATLAAFSTGARETLDAITKDQTVFLERGVFGGTVLHELFMRNNHRSEISPRLALAQALFFVHNGVDINVQDNYGFTALHYACWSPCLCSKLLVEGMIEHGADLSISTHGGLTAFHLAARYARFPEVVQSLLAKSNNWLAYQKSRGQNTPLHWAVSRRCNYVEDVQIFKLLVHSGGDPFVRNRRGLMPIEYGAEGSIVNLLQSLYSALHNVDHRALLMESENSWDHYAYRSLRQEMERERPLDLLAESANDAQNSRIQTVDENDTSLHDTNRERTTDDVSHHDTDADINEVLVPTRITSLERFRKYQDAIKGHMRRWFKRE